MDYKTLRQKTADGPDIPFQYLVYVLASGGTTLFEISRPGTSSLFFGNYEYKCTLSAVEDFRIEDLARIEKEWNLTRLTDRFSDERFRYYYVR